jgi:tetratricopeptide (TPR) repeat protein
VTTLQESLRLDPEYGSAFNLLGVVYVKLGEFEKAVQAIKKYVAVTPGEPNPWDTLGWVYVEMGKVEEAMASYKETLRIQPDFDISNMALSYLYAFKENYSEPSIRSTATCLLTSPRKGGRMAMHGRAFAFIGWVVSASLWRFTTKLRMRVAPATGILKGPFSL